MSGVRLVSLENMQLLVADRFEAQANQKLMANPPDAHDTDESLNRASQCRRLDAADTHCSARLGAEHGNIEHNTDTAYRNIGQRKFIILSAQTQIDMAFQEGPTGSTTLSHELIAH